MRVGVDASPLAAPLTGVGNYILALLQAMVQARPDIEFILYSNKAVVDAAIEIGKVRISPGRHLPGPIWMNTRLRYEVARDGLDVMWFTNGFMPFLMPGKIPSVVTVHDLGYRLAPSAMRLSARIWRSVLQPYAVRMASRLVAVSQSTASDVEEFDGRRANTVIHPLVMSIYRLPSPMTMAKVREKYDLPERFVFSLGTYEPRKNLEALVKSFLILAARGVDVPLLVMAGGSGWQDSGIREAVAEGERLNVVRSLGYVNRNDLPDLYGLAALFVMASVYEGFGMPVLEAQRCGTPVAISDIPSLMEASGGCALTFVPTVAGITETVGLWAEGKLVAPVRPIETLTDQSAAAAYTMLAELDTAAKGRFAR